MAPADRPPLDDLDLTVLRHLMAQGRMTWSELASLLELSAPATADRVRRLEDRQVITGYAAQVNPEAVGCDLTAFITITLTQPEQRAPFLQLVQDLPAIQECHHITGDGDFWLKIRCRNTKALDHLITHHLKSIGTVQTHTTIVLSTHKETPILPI